MSLLKFIAKKLLSSLRRGGRREINLFSEIDLIRKMYSESTDGVMIDVGAHFGESFSDFGNRGWRILAFEPDKNPKKQEAIRRQLNSISTVYTCALSDSPAKDITFYSSDVSTGISGLIPFHESHQSTMTVEMDTLKAVLEREDVSRVNFLKIDTEGNDLLVLKGLDWFVEPDVILCEFEDSKTQMIGYNYKDLGNYLVSAGYTVFMSEWHPIVKYGVQHRWRALRQFPCTLAHANGWGNFIAVAPAKLQIFRNTLASAQIKLS